MAKITFENIEDFMAFVPVLILTAFKNDEFLDDSAAEFFSDIRKKVLPIARQYFIGNPELRLKLKRRLAGFDNNQNVVITIKPDSVSNESYEKKYLSESYRPPVEIARQYLRS
jgi:hypothetical protein